MPFRKLIFLTSFLLLIVIFSPLPAFAQQKSPTPFEEAVKKGHDGQINKEYFDFTTVKNIGSSLNTQIYFMQVGAPPIGALPMMGKALAFLIGKPPVSGVQYLADTGIRLGLISPVYAQGTGWKALQPILSMWRGFRNLAYIFFVIIFIVIGFMIMFRKQINPQTVITIQSALPRIIVTLLLITFSYAIAGLFIDLIYISIYFVTGLFHYAGLTTANLPVAKRLLYDNLFELVYSGKLSEGLFYDGTAEAIESLIQVILGKGPLGDVLSWLGAEVLAKLIIGIALLFVIFKLFFSLLLCYVAIILQVIFAPVMLLFNALPGNNNFSTWLRGLVANVFVFPAIAFVFLVAAALIGNPTWESKSGTCDPNCGSDNPFCIACDVGYYAHQKDQNQWLPPFMGLFSSGKEGVSPVMALIALGMIMMSSKVPDMVKKAFGVEGGVGAAGASALLGGVATPFTTYGALRQYREQRAARRAQKESMEFYKRQRTVAG